MVRESLSVLVLLASLVWPIASRARQATNRDQCGCTELREDGFPIRAEMMLAKADDAGLRDDDVVLGVVIGQAPLDWGRWRALHPGTTVFVDPNLPGRRRFTEETLSRIALGGARHHGVDGARPLSWTTVLR